MTTSHDPAVPIDFSQARAAAAEAQIIQAQNANTPSPPSKYKLSVGRREYDLVPKLSALDEAIMQEAFETNSIRAIVEAMQQLVPKAQRDDLIAYLLADPDDDADRVSSDDVLEAFKTAQEVIAQRPTAK